jgi:pimeloyl-ACP methyl ester carboxylesterase
MLARGASPPRVIVAGMGLDGIVDAVGGNAYFRRVLSNPGTFERGSSEWMAEAFLRSTGGDPAALLHVLDTTVDTPREDLARIETSTLVAVGADDPAVRSAEELADALPNGRFVELPGNHMSAVTKPDLGLAIADFLDER